MDFASIPFPTLFTSASESIAAAMAKRRRKLAQWRASPAARLFSPTPPKRVRWPDGTSGTMPSIPHAEWWKQFDGPQIELTYPTFEDVL